MKTQTLLLIAALGLLGIGDEDEPGWLATALASEDPDVEAAIDAYTGEDFDGATTHIDAAVARRGERAELYYDRGLLLLAQGDADAARAAFEHGTESGDQTVLASSHYELGNLAMAAEDWEGAIAEYIECLVAQPDHQNAKWNLELALLRKEEQEKQEQEEQDEQDQEEGEEGEEGEQGEEGEEGEEGEQDQEGEQNQEGEQDQEQEQEQEQEEQEGEQDQEQEQEQEPEPQQGEEEEAPAQPIEGSDLDSALDELDRQDAFMFGRPRGSNRKVEKDW